ncbi:MAG: protein translocase subunit SecF [candidate division NC10 bacterium]|nr:protein translocase subunit SecF [candidate division NC10 bacterium]
MIELLGKTKIDFMGKRYYAFALSGILVLLGLFALVQILRGQANMGIEFSGGTSVQLKFDGPVEVGKVREALAKARIPESNLQQFSDPSRVLVRVKKEFGGQERMLDQIQAALKQHLPGSGFVIEGSDEIGPAIGKGLRKAAIWAIIISMIGILAYIAWRFEFRFGIAATIATFHDVLAILGVMVLSGKEITLLVVTALLTLAGYSLTDTVVVFDRIRENLRGRRKEPLHGLINFSINEVLPRTIVTSLTTLLAALSIFFLGGEVLHDFSLALSLGIVVGTYSSIFVASSLLVEWHAQVRTKPARRKR